MKVLKQRKAQNHSGPREKPTLQTFHGGNETIIRALAEDLGDRLLCGAEASSLTALDSGHEPKARGSGPACGPPGRGDCGGRTVVIAAPTNVAAKLLRSI